MNPRCSSTTVMRAILGFNEPEMAILDLVLGQKLEKPSIQYRTVFRYWDEAYIKESGKDLTYDDLLDADEAFFSGTAVEITPITILDKKSIGNGLRGKITEKLQSKYSEIVSGQDSDYDHWLTRL